MRPASLRAPIPSETWRNASSGEGGTGAPPAAAGGVMAYDAYDGLVVYFGGSAGGSPRGETWTFSSGRWTNDTPTLPTEPPPGIASAMAYDALFQVILLYGGCVPAMCPDNYTWSFTSSTGWTNLTSALSPSSPAVDGASMAFASDPSDNYTVLFGGCQDALCQSPSNTTFGFTGFGWIRIPTTTAPPPSWAQSLAYDPSVGALVLFGGCVRSTCGDGQTWSYFNGQWQNLTSQVGGGGSPGGRAYSLLTWDELDRGLVLFGGANDSRILNDTWELSCGSASCTWANITVAGTRVPWLLGMAAPSVSNASIGTMFFGGESQPGGWYAPAERFEYSNGTYFLDPGLTLNLTIPGSQPARSSVAVSVGVSGGSGALSRALGLYRAVWSYDGTVTSGPIATLVFPSPGNYSVACTAYDAFGVGATARFFYVATGPASAILGGTTAFAGIPLNLSASAAIGGNPPYYYRWSFGDGGSSNGIVVAHAWSTPGPYAVTLEVIDAKGVVFRTTEELTVLPAPQVYVAPDRTVLDAGQSVRFNQSVWALSGVLRYRWSFGDGSAASSAASPSHRFLSAGLFNVTLIVMNETGVRASGSVNVTVNPKLEANVSASPATGTNGASERFSATPNGGTPPYSVAWTFGDGRADVGSSVTHVYRGEGWYNATAWINDSAGAVVKRTVSVEILPRGGAGVGSSPGDFSGADLAIWIVGIVGGLALVVAWHRHRRREATGRGSRSEPEHASAGERSDAASSSPESP